MAGLLKTHENDDIAQAIKAEIEKDISRHRGWYIFEGVLFLVLAAIVAFLPVITALTFEIIIAALLLVGGVFRLIQTYKTPHNRWWRGATGLIFAGIGLVMLIWPTLGLGIVIYAIGLLLVAEGAFEIAMAFTLRPLRNWAWLLVAGIVSLLLGILVLVEFPLAGILFIAFALAVSMALYGASLLALAWNAGT